MAKSRISTFKQKLTDRQAVIGTFVKTPSMMVAEVLANSNLDCLCFDAEHAPFDRKDIDACILASRASDMPSLVRVPSANKENILNALDCGSTGILVPHVKNADIAREAVQASYFGDNGRGYAGSTRAANYTCSAIANNLAKNKNETVVIAQIEDVEALDHLDAIFSVPNIDCFFIGVMDLTVGLGQISPKSPTVVKALNKIFERAYEHKVCLGMFVPDMGDVPFWRERGASLFMLGSDHSFMLKGANELVSIVKPKV